MLVAFELTDEVFDGVVDHLRGPAVRVDAVGFRDVSVGGALAVSSGAF